MTIGQTISYLRERHSLSQASLARELNIATSTLGMWETDKRKPGPDALVSLADFFGVTTDYLLGRDPKDGLNVAAHMDDDLTPDQKQEILDYIEFKKAQYRKRTEQEE